MENNQNTFSHNDYNTKDVTLTNSQAMIKGGLYSLIFVLILGFCYRFFLINRAVLMDISGIRFPILFIVIIFIVTIIHELLHGIGWVIISRKGWSIIKFNINALMPSCACKVVLEKKQYLVGVLSPFIVLGEKNKTLISDHPTKAGYIAYNKINE